MAKSSIRVVTASSDEAAIIDRGADVKTQLDNLGYEDKGLKTKIGEIAANRLEDDETNIRLEGNRAVATVSETEKLTINAGAETFPALKKAVGDGFLSGVVTVKKDLKVPPDDVVRASEVLREAGINASVVESLSIKSDDLRKMEQCEVASREEYDARQALKGSVESSKSYRIKYDMKKD